MTPHDAYEQLIRTTREIRLLGSAGSVLHWDEQTQMPPRGAEHRANQVSLIARMTHEQFTQPRIGEWLGEIEHSKLVAEAESNAAVNARELRRSYDRAVKIPASLVEEITRTSVLGHHAWKQARQQSEYAIYRPWLAKMLELKIREANCIGFATTPYDALLDEFEPAETTENLRGVFESLRGPLVELVAKIVASPRKAPLEILERRYPRAAQEKLARDAAAMIGFDFAGGRLDTSVHPFCTELGPGDVRMTTRFDESNFGDAFFSVLHESGHGLYSQGLPPEHYGTPRGDDISLGIHESQSRLWENLVGRSKSFWQFFFPSAQAAFPETLRDVTLDDWHFAINDVRPSLIRTESDEATYNLHILLRFELEQAMLTGEVKADDVPAAWNEKMREYLGVTPPDNARGCLQDVHWSHAAIGYFPTYTLGNLYAAQFFEQARKDLGDLDAQFARGAFAPLLEWLRKKIHSQGKKYTARELVRRVSGSNLSAEPLLKHLLRKAGELYGV